jgi:hypothetical protein
VSDSDTYRVSAMLSQALATVQPCAGADDEACCMELATKAAQCLAAIEGMVLHYPATNLTAALPHD